MLLTVGREIKGFWFTPLVPRLSTVLSDEFLQPLLLPLYKSWIPILIVLTKEEGRPSRWKDGLTRSFVHIAYLLFSGAVAVKQKS